MISKAHLTTIESSWYKVWGIDWNPYNWCTPITTGGFDPTTQEPQFLVAYANIN